MEGSGHGKADVEAGRPRRRMTRATCPAVGGKTAEEGDGELNVVGGGECGLQG
jgi:hypothetical protein